MSAVSVSNESFWIDVKSEIDSVSVRYNRDRSQMLNHFVMMNKVGMLGSTENPISGNMKVQHRLTSENYGTLSSPSKDSMAYLEWEVWGGNLVLTPFGGWAKTSVVVKLSDFIKPYEHLTVLGKEEPILDIDVSTGAVQVYQVTDANGKTRMYHLYSDKKSFYALCTVERSKSRNHGDVLVQHTGFIARNSPLMAGHDTTDYISVMHDAAIKMHNSDEVSQSIADLLED